MRGDFLSKEPFPLVYNTKSSLETQTRTHTHIHNNRYTHARTLNNHRLSIEFNRTEPRH